MFGLDNLVDMLFDSAMESINRNERVIKLLKQLNLDPDEPPADFTGVYQYALVEYGVGKPRPVLEIFRQTEIQQLFREALEKNNPTILFQKGEAFLSGHSLQTELQANNVNVRREFYEFVAVFIAVAKRTRTPAEILANQKLESLHRQIGSLQERLKRLPSLEGMRTEMARLADRTYALPGAESASTDRCRAFALAQQMRGWFETLGYRFESHEVWEADYFEWVINVTVWRSRYMRILVRGVDGEASLADVNALRESVSTQNADEGWLVSDRRIARAARDEVAKPENKHLCCDTFDELLDRDADFSGYLSWLEGEIQKRGIDKKYVPLACTKEEYDPATRQRIGASRYDERDGWIDGYLDMWLDDPAKEHISILGEFGTGKTWCALHYAWTALGRYRDAQRRSIERPRLPLVIPLRDYAKAVSVESLFSEFFFRKHEIPIPGYSAFEQLNRMGKLLLIFDGFDEMAARVDRQQMINNFWELAKVVVPGAKVILTCRTEHFPEAREGRALLNAELQASTKNLTGEIPQFEVLELEKFDDEQIRQVLSYQAQPATVNRITGNPQLLDLARRPILTELILEALPDIEAGKPVDMSRVYLYAVRHKMERDIKAERTFTSMADKLYFMCELSWEMLSTDRMSLNYREFPDRIRKLFGSAVEEQKDLDHWHYDMMGQTMLIRNAQGDYTPAHRSLLEFFVAYKFAAELGALAPDFVELAQAQFCFVDTRRQPQDYTWSAYFQPTVDEVGGSLAPLKTFARESIERLRLTVGQTPLSKAVLDLLVPTLTPFSPQAKHPLVKVIEATRDRTPETVGYVGGNAATLATELHPKVLSHQNLSNAIVRGANLVNANLQKASFANAYLAESVFPQIFGAIFAIAYSPNGQYFATAGSTCELNLWNVENNQLVSRFKGHTDWIRSLIFSADSKTLISAAFDETIRIWDLEVGNCTRVLRGHSSRVNSLTISSDSQYIASVSDDKSIKIWNFATGECLRTIVGHTAEVEAILIHDEAKLVISGASDKTIKIWDLPTGKYIKTLHGHTSRVRSLALSPDGKLLASGSQDRTVRLWNLEMGECLHVLEGHSEKMVYSVAFHPDSRTLASGCSDQTIKLWDVETGKCTRTILGHIDWVRTVTFSTDGRRLTSGSDDRAIKHWDIDTGNCLKTLQGYTVEIRSVAVSQDSQTLAIGGEDKCVGAWKADLQGSFLVENYLTLFGHGSRVNSVTVSPDSKIVATASFDHKIKLWDSSTGVCLKTLKGHQKCVNAIALSLDGKLLASSSADRTVRVWNLKTGECLKVLEGHTNWLWALAISPDNCLIASGGDDRTVRLWNLQAGECMTVLKNNRGGIRSVAFTPDSKILATAGISPTIKLWDVSSNICVKSWLAHDSNVRSLAISPSGEKLVSASDDRTLKIWQIETGECLKVLKGHSDRVRSVVFTPDGSKVISGSSDGTIRIWDAETGESLQEIVPLRPYEGMNITGVKGLTGSEKGTLKALGAVEH